MQMVGSTRSRICLSVEARYSQPVAGKTRPLRLWLLPYARRTTLRREHQLQLRRSPKRDQISISLAAVVAPLIPKARYPIVPLVTRCSGNSMVVLAVTDAILTVEHSANQDEPRVKHVPNIVPLMVDRLGLVEIREKRQISRPIVPYRPILKSWAFIFDAGTSAVRCHVEDRRLVTYKKRPSHI